MIKIKILFITLITSLAGVSAQAQLRAGGDRNVVDPAFTGGEKLTFSLSYSLGKVLNSDVVTVVFRTTNTIVNNTPAFRIYANAKTLPNYKIVYDLDDTYETWLDVSTLRPIKGLSRLKEGKYRFRSDQTYDWDNGVVHSIYRNLKRTEDKHKTMALQAKAADALGLFYDLRSQNIADFTPGQTRIMHLVLDDTVRQIKYKYLGKQVKSFRRLGTFNTLKFSCLLASSSGQTFEDGSEFYLWLSDDQNHVPLYIESPIKVGSIVATLIKFEGLKYPLSSKIK